MKTSFTHQDGYHSLLSNTRGHEITIDLPETLGGTNQGPKAFELLAMSLNGCIGTVFCQLARKMRLTIETLRIELDTIEEDTITEVHYRMYIKSDSARERLEQCLERTEHICPVGKLFHQAGVTFHREIIMES